MGDKRLNRVEMLDYFRGFMAMSILIYHYSSWVGLEYFPFLDNTISRLGLYGVLAFYVLSGASMGIVYSHKAANREFLIDFSLKRFFRIAPLFYLATTAMVILLFVQGFISGDYSEFPGVKELILNYTLTFGWLSPDSYITTGAWSIGNELVFYSIFPFMLLLLSKSMKYLYIFFGGTILVSVFFNLYLINPEQSLESQWATYINPLHLLYFFTAGFIIGTLVKQGLKIEKPTLLFLLIGAILLFTLLPADDGNRISYITGPNKILFSLSIILFCVFASFWGDTRKNIFTKVFKFLGDTSYSIYLIHPLTYIVFKVSFGFVGIENNIMLVLLSTVVTIGMAKVIYDYVELPFVKNGKALSERVKKERVA